MDLTASYKILGLDHQADENVAKRAYKLQVKRWHPDQFPDGSSLKATAEERLKQINIAYARVKAHLSLHRHDAPESDTHDQTPDGPSHHEAPPRKKPQRSWMDHLFAALNAFAGERSDASQRASEDQANAKPRPTFEQVLNEMASGFNSSPRRAKTANGSPARRRSTVIHKHSRRRSNRVEGVEPMQSKGPIKPVSRVRGIGKSR